MKIALISEDKALLQQMRGMLADSDNEMTTIGGGTPELQSIAKELVPDLMLLDGRNKEALDLEHVERLTMQIRPLPSS